LFKLHVVAITGRKEYLSYTAINTINFLLQDNVAFFKLDNWQPNSSNFKSVDYAIWDALQDKV